MAKVYKGFLGASEKISQWVKSKFDLAARGQVVRTRTNRVAFSALVILFLLSGCAGPSWVTAGKIIPPVKSYCPLQGKWTVIQDLHNDGNPGRSAWVGKTAQFTRDVAMLGDYVWSEPNYKIKKVNSTDYLMSKYLNVSSTIIPESKDVYVVTLSAADNFLGEFMKVDNMQVIAFVQNNELYLRKISDQVDSSLTSANPNQFSLNEQSKPGVSGVLVGLKIPALPSGGLNYDFTYRTLWIAADHKKLQQILSGNNIFFPRTNGFWKLQVNRIQSGTTTDDVLSAHDVSTKEQDTQMHTMAINSSPAETGTLKRILDYVGNDYVAVENHSGGAENDSGQFAEDTLQVLPVDKISAPGGIKFSDLLGDNGLNAYNSAREEAYRHLSNERVTSFDFDGFEQNFGVIRKNGHWYLRGRINYRNAGKPGYLDFNINMIPPTKLIFYDTLYLSWQNIKDRVPEAVDAFTSPNRDIALVLTKTKLYVYAISAGHLDSEPLAKIGIQDGESVIMAEWATGSYVDNWEKAFLANGAEVLPTEK